MNNNAIPENCVKTETLSVNGLGAGVQTAQGGWTCFHCGDSFIDFAVARLHFGPDETTTPACKIKGAEGGLLKALRDAERQADEHLHMMHNESTEAAKAYHALRCRSEQSIRAAEELGYERGLRDGRALGLDLRPMADAPRDGRYILAIVAPGRGFHLEYQASRAFVIRHEGKTQTGFDLGWAVYPGFGGASDHDFSGWTDLHLPPTPAQEGNANG